MIDLLHTFACPIPGYEALQITVNLGFTDAQVREGWIRADNVVVVGFPEWEQAAARLDLESNEPPIPLTMERSAQIFPIAVSAYLTGYDVINDALRDYMASSRPFLKPR